MARQMDIYDSLRQDHESVKQILNQMMQTSTADADQRAQLLGRLKVEFLAHARAEEKLLYAQLENYQESRDLALEGEKEHHAAEALLEELEQTDVGDDQWKAKLTVLQEMIEHHVTEEESKLFPKAHDVFSAEEEEQLAQQFEDQKRVEQRHI